MKPQERKLMMISRIRRAQSALERTVALLENDSHVETVETALVQAISEAAEAEKLLQPLWSAG